MSNLEIKRNMLHDAIEKYGFEYSLVIGIDNELHEEVIKAQREMMEGK